MNATECMTIEVAATTAETVRKLVESGKYGSAGEVVTASVSHLFAADEPREEDGSGDWIGVEVLPVFERMRTDSSQRLSIEEVQGSLDERAAHYAATE